jgi:RNA polymerase sigma factor (sigma-70 family)
VTWHLRRAALRQDGAGLTDSDLLEQYVTQREEAAFEALLRRHGPMVLGVCCRVLRNEADAEDAFQATFLVLVRKAASIRSRSTLSNWLYGVAHNTALKAMEMNRKRHTKEREAGTILKHEAPSEVLQQVQMLLDAALGKLPKKYRIAIVLCDLEGKTIKEAARYLGWPQGTVATRLTRGRAQLARREGYEPAEGTYTIDPEKKPKEIDLLADAKPWKGIYELKGTTLKLICKRNDRPTDFDSTGGRFLLVLEKK